MISMYPLPILLGKPSYSYTSSGALAGRDARAAQPVCPVAGSSRAERVNAHGLQTSVWDHCCCDH